MFVCLTAIHSGHHIIIETQLTNGQRKSYTNNTCQLPGITHRHTQQLGIPLPALSARADGHQARGPCAQVLQLLLEASLQTVVEVSVPGVRRPAVDISCRILRRTRIDTYSESVLTLEVRHPLAFRTGARQLLLSVQKKKKRPANMYHHRNRL